MLSREVILSALARLSDELERIGVLGELNIVGGTAMILAFNARTATKNVDAIFSPANEVRKAAALVATSLALPVDWLNDAAKGYLSASGVFTPLTTVELPSLRIQAPTPEYMLAMKVMAARTVTANERGDSADIALLIQMLGISDAAAVMDIVKRYYDPSRILPRSYYPVDEILEDLRS